MPLPPLTSYKQILFPTKATADFVDDLVTNRLPFPANGKNGIIIYGPTGTGKTSLMRLLPNALEDHRSGEVAYSPNYWAIDESTKPSNLFGSIHKLAANVPLSGSHNYFQLDEVDLLKTTAMRSLKSVMNLPISIFIFATNELNGIDPPIISRCHLIDMNPPPPSTVISLVKEVISNAGVTTQLPDDVIEKLIEKCCGDMRNIGDEIDRIINEKIRLSELQS